MTTTCLVLHRKSANRPEVKAAVKHVRDEGIDLRVRIPWNKKDKPRVVAEALAAGATRVIAGGGDGTINAVASALVNEGSDLGRAELGILPLGTANDFANGCGLPVADLNECLKIACTRDARRIDVGKVNKRYFINVASGGYGAEITATTPVEMKRRLGGVAYTIMGVLKAFDLQPYRGRLSVPGEEPLEGAMLVAAVGNNRLAGGGFEVASNARMDDGLLDLAFVLHRTPMDLPKLAAELKNPTDPSNEFLYYRQLSAFEIRSEDRLHFNVDGEPMLKKRLRFSLLPGHLAVVF